jgi:hypothetical protein
MPNERKITREEVMKGVLSDEEIGPDRRFNYNLRTLLDMPELSPDQLSDYVAHARDLIEELKIGENPAYTCFLRRFEMYDEAERNTREWLAKNKRDSPD